MAVVRAGWLIALLAGALLLPAAPARAHARLLSTAPADGATLAAAPGEVVLEFSEHVEDDFNHVQVRAPGGERVDAGAPDADGAVVRVGLQALTAAGAYEVAYRVLSVDGHPVEGSFTFVLAEEAVAAEPSPSPGAGTEPETEAETGTEPETEAETGTEPETEAETAPPDDPTPDAAASPEAAAATGAGGGFLPWALVAAIAALTVAGVVLLRGQRED